MIFSAEIPAEVRTLRQEYDRKNETIRGKLYSPSLPVNMINKQRLHNESPQTPYSNHIPLEYDDENDSFLYDSEKDDVASLNDLRMN